MHDALNCVVNFVKNGLLLAILSNTSAIVALRSCGTLLTSATWRQAVISACDKGGRLDKALEVYHDMEAAGLEADLITFSNLVSGMPFVAVWASQA